jgi:hypothetical protein
MMATGTIKLDPDRFDLIVSGALSQYTQREEMVDAFRTVSWIQRSDDGAIAFRHEALTCVCAAEHVWSRLEDRDSRSLGEWDQNAALADVVCEYAGEIISGRAILHAFGLLDGDLPINVRQLVMAVLTEARNRTDIAQSVGIIDLPNFPATIRGIVRAPDLAQTVLPALMGTLNERRTMEVALPLLFLLAPAASSDATNLSIGLLDAVVGKTRNFSELLREVKADKGRLIDSILLKELRVPEYALLDVIQFEPLFRRLDGDPAVPSKLRHYAERTLKAVEGAKQRRAESAKGAYTRPRTRPR